MAADTRTTVLDAAARLFDARGFAAVSIGDLTAASGVSNGSIYHHFGSKDGVLAEVVAGALEGYHQTLLATLAEHPHDGPGGVRAAVAHELRWFVDHPREARLVLAHRDAVAATGRLRAPNRAVLTAVGAWAREAIDPNIDINVLHAVVFSPARSIGALWATKRIKNDPTAYAAALGDAAWAGLKATQSP
jgi:AcrR family transcriptional regulator